MADEIVIRPPGPDKPGYLRRVRTAMGIQNRLASDGGVDAFDAMLDFILGEAEVVVPDGVDPREALLDLSQTEYETIFSSFTGGNNGAVDPQNGA